MDNSTFKRVSQEHLDKYVPEVIDKYGHCILHGDGNMYVDDEGVQKEHQRSYIAKTYAGVGNEAATYVIKFTDVEDVPKTLEKLQEMFLAVKAREKFEGDKVDSNDKFKSIGSTKKETKSDVLADTLKEKEAELEAAKKENEEKEAELVNSKKAEADAKLEAEIQAEENAKLKKQLEKLQKAVKKEEKTDPPPTGDEKTSETEQN